MYRSHRTWGGLGFACWGTTGMGCSYASQPSERCSLPGPRLSLTDRVERYHFFRALSAGPAGAAPLSIEALLDIDCTWLTEIIGQHCSKGVPWILQLQEI